MFSPLRNNRLIFHFSPDCFVLHIFAFIFWVFINGIEQTHAACKSQLWPANSPLMTQNFSLNATELHDVILQAEQLKTYQPTPSQHLHSAGQIQIDNLELQLSRQAFQDADRGLILALAYRLTHNTVYLTKAIAILSAWAETYQPSGHPIDETRLDSLVWTYDLLKCDLPVKARPPILHWFSELATAKRSWIFGPRTKFNNHHVHQLKMLLLLDKILHDKAMWSHDLTDAIQLLSHNIATSSGITIDYQERHALYYQNYSLEAWLEICLITQKNWLAVLHAFAWQSQQILSQNIEHEFVNSQAKIDAQRARGGFTYAITGSTFNVFKAAPTILAYYTLVKMPPQADLWRIQQDSPSSLRLIFLRARQYLWAN